MESQEIKEKLEIVLRVFDEIGMSQVAIAKKINRSKQTVNKWQYHGIPPKYCPCVEELLKQNGSNITRKDIRPVDWELFWPELKAA